MAHSTEHHTQAQHLDQLIAEAADATGILPTIDRCQQLHDELRAAIGQLALAFQTRPRLEFAAVDTVGNPVGDLLPHVHGPGRIHHRLLITHGSSVKRPATPCDAR